MRFSFPSLSASWPVRNRGRTLRFWLGWLVVACALPAWAATGLSIARSYQRESATLQTGTVGTARALAQAIDGELWSVQTALEALATSPQFAAGDLAAFYDQAQAIVRALPIVNMVVLKPTGEQLLNTFKPWGAPLPLHGAPDPILRVFTTGRPVVSNLFVGPVIGQSVVAVCVPVARGGTVAYGLGMTIAPERLGDILRRQNLASGWVAAVIDGNATIAASTDAPSVGRKIDPTLWRQIEQSAEGVVESDARDGTPLLASYSRSAVSGWSVLIGIPKAGLETDLRRSSWLTAGVASILLLLALIFARFISLRISSSIEALREPALALGSDRAIAFAAGKIAEVNEIGKSLEAASQILQQRLIERENALRNEHRMMTAKEAAEQANRAKSEFLAMMSHEIRTPMNGVVGYAQLLADAPIQPKYQDYAQIIDSSAASLLTVINDILDFSKIEAGKLDVDSIPVDLSKIVERAISLVGIAAAAKGLRLEMQPGGGATATWVQADPDRLSQVLINLLGNAVKFSERGTIKVAIETVADGRIRVAVTDEGIGIPSDAFDRLFQSFSQVDSTIGNRGGGTGLGLAISKRLVELMGGQIGVESTPGRGSCFSFTLRSAVAPAPPPETRAEREADRGSPSPARILVVDDNPINRRLVQAYLEGQGHHLDFAANGGEGVEKAAAATYDLILMDVNMPGIDGIEATRLIRASGGENAAVSIIALTASATSEEVARCLSAGMSGHVAKPITLSDLTRVVAVHARSKESISALC